MSKIYGFFCSSHSANCCLIEDGQIVHCLEEERMTRIKAGDIHDSYPNLSYKKIQEKTGVSVSDADYRIFAEPYSISYAKSLTHNN